MLAGKANFTDLKMVKNAIVLEDDTVGCLVRDVAEGVKYCNCGLVSNGGIQVSDVIVGGELLEFVGDEWKFAKS
mgnify:CR=1 FL=1